VTAPEPPKKPRELAAMTPERRRAIARLGGQAVQAQGKGHTFTREEAAAAGRKGARAAQAKGVASLFTGEEARAAGRRGGLDRWEGRPAATRPRAGRRPGGREAS